MDNQMKICFISLDQFNMIWHKSMPQDRYGSELTTLAMMSKPYNTLFIVGKQEDFIVKVESVLVPDWIVK